MSLDLPAWSEPFAEGNRESLHHEGPWGRIDRGWAFGDSSGRGLRVAIVDSGVERDHPAVGVVQADDRVHRRPVPRRRPSPRPGAAA